MKNKIHPMALILTMCLFLGGDYAGQLFLIASVCGIIYYCVKSYKTGTYKEINNSKRYNEYYHKQKAIHERYENDKVIRDPETGKLRKEHQSEYLEDIKKLNNEFAIKGSEEYDRIRERERNWMK